MPDDEEVFTPKLGELLGGEGLVMVVDAVKARQERFPDEPLEMTLALVLMNVGDRFTPIECLEGEWSGMKRDVTRFDDEKNPLCPGGHRLQTKGRGLALGWLTSRQ